MTTPRVSVLITTLNLSDKKKREWDALMDYMGEKHGISCAWWPAHRSRYDGKAHLLTYAMQATPTVEKAAHVLANNSAYTYEQIIGVIDLLDFEGDTPRERLMLADAWIHDESRVDDWEYEGIPDWMIEPEPEFVEPEEPPEGWPISIPLQWEVVMEEEGINGAMPR